MQGDIELISDPNYEWSGVLHGTGDMVGLGTEIDSDVD